MERKLGHRVITSTKNARLFGIITDIVVHHADHVYFVCNVLHTECFNSHFHAYEVSKTIRIMIFAPILILSTTMFSVFTHFHPIPHVSYP